MSAALDHRAKNALTLKSGQLESIQQAAQSGKVSEQMLLSQLYQYGVGVAQDTTQAKSWVHKAAASGHPEGKMFLARHYEKGELFPRDRQRAVELTQQAAVQGLAQAQWYLARYHRVGDLLPRNLAQYHHWVLQAAKQTPPDIFVAKAQMSLASDYAQGDGIEKDPAQSHYWYTQAAKLNHPVAQFQAAEYYRKAQQQWALAACWYLKSAENDHLPAQLAIADAYQNAWGQQLVQNYGRAFHWYQMAANRKEKNALVASAQFHLSNAYLHGLGTEKDPALAYAYAKQAATLGHQKAQQLIPMLKTRLNPATLMQGEKTLRKMSLERVD